MKKKKVLSDDKRTLNSIEHSKQIERRKTNNSKIDVSIIADELLRCFTCCEFHNNKAIEFR